MSEIHLDYTIVVSPLSEEDGGGFVARVPDLPGCMGDGDTPEAAVKDARNAVAEWLDEYAKIGRDIPEAGSSLALAQERRAKELRVLTELKARVMQNEKDLAGIDCRLDEIEKSVEYLIDLLENQEEWERFAVITKTTRGTGDLFSIVNAKLS